MPTNDLLHFLRRWFADPARIGAIAPSGRALVHLMTREITPATRRVIELGAGTGVFTRALLARGIHEADLVLVEQDAAFAALLRERFPRAQVLRMDAAGLGDWLRARRLRAGAVVSGLPLLNFAPARVDAILEGAFDGLREDGAFFQFTYGVRCPVPAHALDRLDLRSTRIGFAVRNLPPATVHRIRRRSPGHAGGA